MSIDKTTIALGALGEAMLNVSQGLQGASAAKAVENLIIAHLDARLSPAPVGGETEEVSLEIMTERPRRFLGTVTPPPAEPDGGDARKKFDLWFFRDNADRDRRNLFALFDMPIDELKSLGTQRKALDHIFGLLALATLAERDRRIAALEEGLLVALGDVNDDAVAKQIAAILSPATDKGGE